MGTSSPAFRAPVQSQKSRTPPPFPSSTVIRIRPPTLNYRGRSQERVNAGLAAAKTRGVKLGRPRTLTMRRDEVIRLKEDGKGVREIARELAMPPSSAHKVLSIAVDDSQ